jgi:hypothetical protein
MRRGMIVGVVALLVAFALSVLSRGQAKETAPGPLTQDKGQGTQDKGPRDKGPKPEAPGARLEVPPPPFSDGIFPCTQCHNKDMPPNRARRTLSDMHTDIELKHDTAHRWCLDCHDADHRDQLHLASGEPVKFEESYRLCGQCHGEKYRDWRAGVHGRRVGQWNGTKQYLLCVHCHSPHQPRFKSMAPHPAPVRPKRPQ